jgi:hypothetical protein
MSTKDIIRLNMAKNAEGKWHCPVTFKVGLIPHRGHHKHTFTCNQEASQLGLAPLQAPHPISHRRLPCTCTHPCQ